MPVRSFVAPVALLLAPVSLAAQGGAAPASEAGPVPQTAPAPTIITIRPGAGFDTTPSPPSPSAAPLAPAISGPPGAAPAQDLVPFEEALARRRAANTPTPPPGTSTRQSSGMRCIERADGSTSCSQSSSTGSSPEARARAEAAARGELDRLNNPPPR